MDTQDQHTQPQKQIGTCRKGHQNLRRSADSSGTAQKHGPHQHCQKDARTEMFPESHIAAEGGNYLIQSRDHRVDLCGIAHAESGKDTEKAIDRS